MKILIIRGFPEKIPINGYNSQELGLARALRKKGHVCDIVYFGGREPDHVQVVSALASSGNDENPSGSGSASAVRKTSENNVDMAETEDTAASGIRIFWRHGRNIAKNGVMPGLRKLAEGYDVVQVNEYDQLESWLFYTFYSPVSREAPEKGQGKRRIRGGRNHSHRIPVVIYNGNYFSEFNHGYNLKCKVFDHTLLKITGEKRREFYCLTKSVPGKTFLEEKGFSPDRIVPAGVGLDPEPLERDPQHHIADQMPEGTFELLYIGKLEERRNIPFLLSVIEKAHAINPRIHATVIGNGADTYLDTLFVPSGLRSGQDGNSVKTDSEKDKGASQEKETTTSVSNAEDMLTIGEKLQELEAAGIVSYFEKAPQNELASVYEKTQMLLLPTSYEIFGMVLLEAMYFGCVPLTTWNGGSSVLIRNGENGFIEETGTDEEIGKWCGDILELAADPAKWEAMSGTARQEVRDHFTWESLADTFLCVYRKAAEQEMEIR